MYLEWTSLVAQTVKNPPATQETQVQSLGWEDPLEKGMAVHTSILIWRIPWTEEPGGLQSMELQSQTQPKRPTLHFECPFSVASLVAQSVKNLPAVQETRVRSLGQEDPLAKEMATHSSILAWRIPWTEEPGRL